MKSLKVFFPNVSEQEMVSIWYLVKSWENDPCWDLEHTESFEQYHDALLAYRLAYEAERVANEMSRLNKKAIQYGCCVELIKYIETIESRIEYLERKIKQIEDD